VNPAQNPMISMQGFGLTWEMRWEKRSPMPCGAICIENGHTVPTIAHLIRCGQTARGTGFAAKDSFAWRQLELRRAE
jgi:hypothetical protein